jgi:isocitrate/isopropylmalate dehydrogenase
LVISAPDIAGQKVAHPTSMILSVAMLVEWLGKRQANARLLRASKQIGEATDHTLADPGSRTRDIDGNTPTDEFANQVARLIETSERIDLAGQNQRHR